VIPLYYASKRDIKYHRIDKKYVIAIFLIVLIYTLLSKEYVIERTFSFLITLGIFSGITIISKGGFGFGDTLILAAIGWYIGSLMHLRNFYLILVVVMLGWGTYYILKNRKDKKTSLKDYFKTITVVPISKVIPGMILAKDYFMTGLTEKDIEQLKSEGYIALDIKQAYPFIPVILMAYIVHLFAAIYF